MRWEMVAVAPKFLGDAACDMSLVAEEARLGDDGVWLNMFKTDGGTNLGMFLTRKEAKELRKAIKEILDGSAA